MIFSTMIGSLPYKNAGEAMELLLKYVLSLPAWPQLPKIDFKEEMIVQYSENFPGIYLDEADRKITVNTRKAYPELEIFYQNYLDSNFNYFSISESYAKGFYAFLEGIKSVKNLPRNLKCQTVGPITFGMMLKDENGRSIFFDEQLRDVIIKHIAMKSLWQIRELSGIQHPPSNIIVFLDEPYLAAYGSAFTAINREEITKTIGDTLNEIKTLLLKLLPETKVEIGIHCCGNTDWSLLLDSDIDIISFDAYGYFDNLLLYSDELNSFLQRTGKLAWGIVPTNAESIEKETLESLIALLEKQVTQLKARIENFKVNQIIITPSCGMGSLSEELAEKVLGYTKAVSEFF